MPKLRFTLLLLPGLALALTLSLLAKPAYAWPWDPQNWEQAKALVRKNFPQAPLMSVTELNARLADDTRPKPLLIDVRGRAEFDDSHLPGAVHAETLNAAVALLSGRSRDTPIVVYCSVGYRSGKLAEGLLARGFTQVSNLEGSIFEWANSGLPVYQGTAVVSKVHPYNTSWGRLLKRELWSREP